MKNKNIGKNCNMKKQVNKRMRRKKQGKRQEQKSRKTIKNHNTRRKIVEAKAKTHIQKRANREERNMMRRKGGKNKRKN